MTSGWAGIFFALLFNSAVAQQLLPPDSVFEPGERIDYRIAYHWGFVWVDAGEVSFTVDSIQYNQQPAYLLTGKGKTLAKWDWFYKVRDLYQSTTTMGDTMAPLEFIRKVEEGKTFIDYEYHFNHEEQLAYSKRTFKDGSLKRDTLKCTLDVSDVLSMIYVARRIDFSQFKDGDKIPIRVLLDNEVNDSYIRFLGEEEIEVDEMGLIRCFKFRPLLIEGTIFKGGEDMLVYVSADQNRVPVMIETPILVGSIKAIVAKTEGTRSPLKFTPED
ncbi:DUF3108 domain-containing protein [bacterium SCSIO 12741]|nr:DUF3108 domain-containing protein [bacterium SCSIO 12741]